MQREMILCIPGPWEDSSELVRQTITLEPAGTYMFAGAILAHPAGNDHIPVVFEPHDERMVESFRIAGQGKISSETLARIEAHKGVAYLIFPLDVPDQRERILKYTKIFHRLGGFGVKIESSGLAHDWDRWFSLLSGNEFEVYCSMITLVADHDCYYSCGMHHFGLAEGAVSNAVPLEDAAHVMNQFNFWRMIESPEIASGHTFSPDAESPRYRMKHAPDHRHEPDELFHNPHGVWTLEPV